MSKGLPSDRFSSGELSALLDEDCDGHRLAEFLLKKHGGTTRPKRIFAAYKPERFSIDVRTEKIKSPTGQKNASPKTTTSNELQLEIDVAKKQLAIDECVPLQEQNNGTASDPILPGGSPSLQPVNNPVPIRSSPSERLSMRRSGAMPSADRLRRFSLKRLSTMSVGRKLLKEFDSTLTDSKFSPPICSTPMTHSPADQTPCISKKFEDKPAKAVQTGATSTIPSSSTDTHNNTERMLNSLRQHDAALNHMLDHNSNETIKQIFEKENLDRNTAKTPPLTHKQTNQRSRLTTPVSNQRSRPTTPVSNQHSRPTTPVSNQRSRPTTPVSNQHSRLTTPVSNQRSRPTTPVYNQHSRPTTPVSNHRSRSTTPVSSTRRRTYIVEKGSQPGQVVLTPAKSPPPQEQQPTSTVEDGLLSLPSSPVEEAVYALHTINLDTPESPTLAHSLPVKPLLASPKILRVKERNATSNNPQPTSGFKVISKKKSRIPLMTPAAKLKCNLAHIEVPNTPEINVNITRTHAVIPETHEDSDVDIPETQDLPMETQQILETLRKKSSVTPMIVIPIHQTFNHTPTQSHETTTNAGHKVKPKVNKTTTTPVNIEADTTMCQLTSNKANKVDKKSTTSARSSESLLIESPTPEIISNEDYLRLCDILTDDDDEQILPMSRSNRRHVSSDESQMECSNVPLNLASQPKPPPQQSDSHSSSTTRSRRLRKRSTRRTQQQQTKLSPLLSTETESEIGPPRAHPLITRHTSGRQSRKIPLNAAPNTPINGERFAVEMKTYLARLNNREILDLRKRNSLGKVFAVSGRRKSSLGRKSSLSAKETLEKQLQLEEEIQMEILKRNLNDEFVGAGVGKGSQPHSPKSVFATEEEQVVYDAPPPDVETEHIYEMTNEEAELLHTIPPAPENFRDITTHQSLAKSLLWQTKDYTESSLVDDNSREQVKFVSDDISKKSTQTKSTKRSGRRSKKPVPEVMQKYLEVHNKINTRKTYGNQSKRGLYSQENEISQSENSSFEQGKSPAETSTAATTRVEQQQKQQLEKTLSTSKRRTEHPLLPPDSFADELVHTTAATSMTVSTVSGTSVANDKDNNVFKKPKNPAPIAKKTKKFNRGEVKRKNAADVIESCTTEPNDETSTLRRSKRGPKPLTNYWSFRSTDPMPLYDVAILEKRREEAKKLREMRLQNSKASITGENFTMSTASSSSSSSTTKRGRARKPINFLGDTDSSSAASVTSAPRQKRLTMVQEIESQSVNASDQMYQDLNLGDNMFNRLDEVDISVSRTHKVSRTPQRNNNSTTSKTTGDVEKVAKKKATKTAIKQKKPQTKKSTKAAVATGGQNKAAPINDTHESTEHFAVHSHTAAHINDIFEKLKNDMTADTTLTTNPPPNSTNSIPSTSKKCRIRLSRFKVTNDSNSKRTSSNSKKSSKVNLTSSETKDKESMSCSNAPSWLRDISHVGSKILMDTDKEKEMFEQMLCSQPGNLVLTAIDGLDYAYYENNKEIPFGYMRFQPNQAKPIKRARHFDLRFFVLSGKFKICTNKDIAHFSEGSVITILKGSSYSITNITDKLAIMMVFRNQDN